MIPPSPVLGPGLGIIMDSSTVIIVGLAKEIPGDCRCVIAFLVVSAFLYLPAGVSNPLYLV